MRWADWARRFSTSHLDTAGQSRAHTGNGLRPSGLGHPPKPGWARPYGGRVDPEAWGVATSFSDGDGNRIEPSPATLGAILATLGAQSPPPERADLGPVIVHPGETPELAPGSSVMLEDGTELGSTLPPDLPLGYHQLVETETGTSRTLIASPGSCILPQRRRWGWAIQLYATRSARSWGMGDLGDLDRLGRGLSRLGAEVMMVNPLHAPLPGHPQEASPYYPSSRQFLSPLYLDVAAVPGAAGLGEVLAALDRAGQALNSRRHIDRDAVLDLKLQALERIWAATGDVGGDFETFVASGGSALEDFATYSMVAELHGPTWPGWPPELRHPASAAVAELRRQRIDRVRFHQWVQWLLADQWRRSSEAVSVVADLAVGVNPAGADAWIWQDLMCFEMSVGAPPDEFNLRGQDWGIPPFNPWALRAGDYEPFIGMVRASMHGGGGIRLDHVLGLFRQFWIPKEGEQMDGTYVSFPTSDLLDIVALESHRAGAFVVGEDLGNVGEGVREELAHRNVLSYRLLWFEPDGPRTWPRPSVASVTTHDLPTITGLWSGDDLRDQHQAGVEPSVAGSAAARDHLAQSMGVTPESPIEDVVVAAYRRLSEAPSLIRTATLEDALCVSERTNIPGTTAEQRANWSLALPVRIEDLSAHPGVQRVAEVMGDGLDPHGDDGGAPGDAG